MTTSDDYTTYVTGAWPRLFRTAYALTGRYSDAEDLLQASLVKAFVSWRRVTKAETPDAYVRRIIVNEHISRGRASSRRLEHLTAFPTGGIQDGHEDRLASSAVVWEALTRLPPRQRAVVVLRYYEGLSERETANVLGVAPGTVKSQASAALASLRLALNEAFQSPSEEG